MKEGFTRFDLEMLGEMLRIFSLIASSELVEMEQRNRADFCRRYCKSLMGRIEECDVKGVFNKE